MHVFEAGPLKKQILNEAEVSFTFLAPTNLELLFPIRCVFTDLPPETQFGQSI